MRILQMPIELKSIENPFIEKTPHFVEYVRKYIEEKYGKDGLYKQGLQVYTTIDTDFQRIAQEAVESGLKEIEKRQKYSFMSTPLTLEGSLLCFDLETGFIKAMVGGRDYKKSQFNRAIQARRQTGSAFKPIVYASALDKGYTPASIIVDSPIVITWGNQKWTPQNYDGKYLGPTTLKNALTQSINVVTVKIAEHIGIDYIKDYARKLGISSSLHDNLSMALGSSSISLFEVTKAYAVFANQGHRFNPIFIKKILDRDGNLLEENIPLFYQDEILNDDLILTPQTAYLITNLLENVVQNGTGWRAKALARPVAGKTGTTDRFMDAWFIGFTPELITGVWVGFDEEKSLGDDETGARAASPIWVTFMSKILKDRPIKNFLIPEGIEFARVDSKTGQGSTGREAILECFKEGTGPEQQASPLSKATTDFFKFDFNSATRTK
jgi:penicillin-binding protein 1A